MTEEIKREEGFRGNPYKDHLGYPTIGYGTKLPINEEEAELLLNYRLEKMKKEVNRRMKERYGEISLPDEVWEILYHMAYQLGVGGLMRFRRTIGAIVRGEYVLASHHGLDSRWAKQTPARARRLMGRLSKLGK